ncbi:MAG TPA: sulfite exporter TauE/SafE family protein [Bacteroidales bacterium]|nr:sulfite exporter TauE/SafE family protein [Bacteroidales bacterium]
MTESFILGLSTGSACLITCGIVMFPYMMAGSAGIKMIIYDILVFLLGRLLIYFMFATITWYMGRMILTASPFISSVTGFLYIAFAILLLFYSLSKKKTKNCPVYTVSKLEKSRVVPLFAGILNSIGFCPALLILITKGVTDNSTLAHTYLSFIAFFAGSSLWFLPLPLAGKVRKRQVISTIGILATGLAGLIFIVKGITILIGGIIYG